MVAIEDGLRFVSTDLHGNFLRHAGLHEISHAAASQIVEQRAAVLSHGRRALRKSEFEAGGLPDGVDRLDPLAVSMTQPGARRRVGQLISSKKFCRRLTGRTGVTGCS